MDAFSDSSSDETAGGEYEEMEAAYEWNLGAVRAGERDYGSASNNYVDTKY